MPQCTPTHDNKKGGNKLQEFLSELHSCDFSDQPLSLVGQNASSQQNFLESCHKNKSITRVYCKPE
jgi:outer membrane PBP1 activator LpoA protein